MTAKRRPGRPRRESWTPARWTARQVERWSPKNSFEDMSLGELKQVAARAEQEFGRAPSEAERSRLQRLLRECRQELSKRTALAASVASA